MDDEEDEDEICELVEDFVILVDEEDEDATVIAEVDMLFVLDELVLVDTVGGLAVEPEGGGDGVAVAVTITTLVVSCLFTLNFRSCD